VVIVSVVGCASGAYWSSRATVTDGDIERTIIVISASDISFILPYMSDSLLYGSSVLPLFINSGIEC